MLTKIAKDWWMLQYEDVEGKYAWFAETEAQVKGKFESWMTRKTMREISNQVTYDLPVENTSLYSTTATRCAMEIH